MHKSTEPMRMRCDACDLITVLLLHHARVGGWEGGSRQQAAVEDGMRLLMLHIED